MDSRKVACIGAGLIGSSWATHFILKGLDVTLYDLDQPRLDDAYGSVARNIGFLESEGVIDAALAEQCLGRLTLTSDMAVAVKDAAFIQESGPENYEIKHSIIAEVEKFAPETAVILSSTSGLSITKIAEHAEHPERIVGAHPYNPPHLIPLVEMVKGDQTSEESIDQAVAFYQSVDKEPVVLKKELIGFIANRLSVALYREAVDIVRQGACSIEDVDKACLYGPGLRYGLLGPNMIYQLGGGKLGIAGIIKHIGPTVETWWKDMATWTEWPEGYSDLVQSGVEEARRHRKPEHGIEDAEIAEFRDRGLISLLKFHGKL